jgi:hypothetical protein
MNTPLAVKLFSFSKTPIRFHASLSVAMLLVVVTVPIARGVDIISNGPVSYLKGSDAINPRPGTQGSGPQFNSLFYVLPGEGDAADCPTPQNCHNERHAPPNQPFYIAYEPAAQPVQTSD